MGMNVTYTTDLVEKTRIVKDDGHGYGDEEQTYWECPNCGEIETSWYEVEEHGAGTHTLAECFANLRERIAKLEGVPGPLIGSGSAHDLPPAIPVHGLAPIERSNRSEAGLTGAGKGVEKRVIATVPRKAKAIPAVPVCGQRDCVRFGQRHTSEHIYK